LATFPCLGREERRVDNSLRKSKHKDLVHISIVVVVGGDMVHVSM
jgi:hypothetical protein